MNQLASAASGIVRISLLGAARQLLTLPKAPAEGASSLDPLTVALPSPHGSLIVPPPPLTVDGATIERPVGGYGQARLAWLPDAF